MDQLNDSDDLLSTFYNLFEADPESPPAEESEELEDDRDWPFEITSEADLEDPPQGSAQDCWSPEPQPSLESTADGPVYSLAELSKALTWSVDPS